MSRRTLLHRRGPFLRKLPALLVAAVAGVVLGVLAGTVPGHHPEPASLAEKQQRDLADAAESTPGDRVQGALDDLRRTGFHVGPELRGQLSADEIATVEDRIASSPTPMFVVYWSQTREGGYHNDESALTQIRAHLARDGFYAVLPAGGYPRLGVYGYEDVYVDADGTGRPAQALLRLVDALAAEEAERPAPPSESDFDYWGGPVGGFFAGLLFVALGYGALWLVFAIVRATMSSSRRRST